MALGVALLIAVTLTSFGAGRVAGQDVGVASGARVRVVALGVSAKPFVGQLIASNEGTLTIVRSKGGSRWLGWPFNRTTEETLTLPRESVTQLERSVRPSRKTLGKVIGGIVGIAAGAAVLARETDGDCSGCGILVAVGAVPFALLGAAIAPGDRWAPEDPRKVRGGFTPVRGGAGVQVSLAF